MQILTDHDKVDGHGIVTINGGGIIEPKYQIITIIKKYENYPY